MTLTREAAAHGSQPRYPETGRSASLSPGGELQHTGRKTGRAYVTPVGARRKDDLVLIPLTFGNQSDWALNVLAACGCTIQIQGAIFPATMPLLLSPADAQNLARTLFPITRLSFKLLGVKQFMQLDAQ